MLTSILLPAHVALGFAGILLGPVAMLSRKAPGFHPRIGELYHAAMLGVCLSAAALALLDWARLWAFLPIAVGSYAFAWGCARSPSAPAKEDHDSFIIRGVGRTTNTKGEIR